MNALQTLASARGLDPEKVKLAVLFGGGYLVLTLLFLRSYLLWEPQLLLSVALLPLVTFSSGHKKGSAILLWAAVLVIGAAGYLQITTLYFMAFLLAFWYGLQTLWGRTGLYPLLLLGLASPIFSYFTRIWSFPLRLKLTEGAVYILKFGYPSAEVSGSTIFLEGEQFSVDPACAGLNMLSFSLLLAVLTMAMLHKRSQKSWPFWALGVGLISMVVLNLGANLIRILLLVIFKIGPESPLHDLMGLLTLLVYALLPFFFLARLVHKVVPESHPPKVLFANKTDKRSLVINFCLVVGLAVAGYQVLNKKIMYASFSLPPENYVKAMANDDVQKYSNEKALVYVKPIRAFYSAEHHPFICWQGSGYTFVDVQESSFQGQELYTGTLVKEKDLLYTAWWMDNGQHQTITQTDWRWRMLKGEPTFYLVNITAPTQQDLQNQMAIWLSRSIKK